MFKSLGSFYLQFLDLGPGVQVIWVLSLSSSGVWDWCSSHLFFFFSLSYVLSPVFKSFGFSLMFYCLGPGVQYLADNRLLLDPLVSPLHPLQLHLPRRLGAHQEVKGKSRSNPHGTITPRSLARVFDPADIDRIGILVNIAPIRLQEEEKKDSNPTPSPVPIWQSYSPKLVLKYTG